MAEERVIYWGRALQFPAAMAPRPARRDGRFPLYLHIFNQSRSWHDDPATYTVDEWSLVKRQGYTVTAEQLRPRMMKGILCSQAGVPLGVQQPILENITQFAQVADLQYPFHVAIVKISIRSLGSVEYQDIVDFVSREEIHFEFSPTPHARSPSAPHTGRDPMVITQRYISNPAVPASRSSIEGLSRVRFDSLEQDDIREMTCSICFVEFEELPDKLVTSLPCHHLYHVECITQWLERDGSCPMCRYQMPRRPFQL